MLLGCSCSYIALVGLELLDIPGLCLRKVIGDCFMRIKLVKIIVEGHKMSSEGRLANEALLSQGLSGLEEELVSDETFPI